MAHHGGIDFHANGNSHTHDIGGQFHGQTGPHSEVNIGANHHTDHGHHETTVHGGFDAHPTDHSTIGVGGSYNNHGGYDVGVHGSVNW